MAFLLYDTLWVMCMLYPRIRELREEKEWTQQKMAELLHVNRRTCCSYENGSREPVGDIVIALACIHDVSVDYILNCTDSREYHPRAEEFRKKE